MLFDWKAGYFRETDHDAVMEKVDRDGNVLGFSVLKVRAHSHQSPLSVFFKKKTG